MPFETKRYLFEALMNAKLKKTSQIFQILSPKKYFAIPEFRNWKTFFGLKILKIYEFFCQSFQKFVDSMFQKEKQKML